MLQRFVAEHYAAMNVRSGSDSGAWVMQLADCALVAGRLCSRLCSCVVS